jgi:hypothetical protein
LFRGFRRKCCGGTVRRPAYRHNNGENNYVIIGHRLGNVKAVGHKRSQNGREKFEIVIAKKMSVRMGNALLLEGFKKEERVH